jgi:hypothetical protein
VIVNIEAPIIVNERLQDVLSALASAATKRDIHFDLSFLVRVFNSALMNLVASEAESGPWTRPRLAAPPSRFCFGQ